MPVPPQMANEAADRQENDPKSRWERGVFLAGRLMDGDALHHVQAIDVDKDQKSPPPAYTQNLAEQHWLELVDGYFISSLYSCSILIIFIGNTAMDLTVRHLSVATTSVLLINRCNPTVKVRRLVLNSITRMDKTYSLASGTTKHGQRRTQTKTSFDGRCGFLLTTHSHNNLHNHYRLDHGGGQHISLPQCSREQLEKEV